MTRQKAQKRATRARMAKTGESYTAARRHALEAKEDLRAAEELQTDAAVRKNTGRGWKGWLQVLDEWGAKERRHGQIAKFLMEERGVPGWWAQTITVGYERSRGMRAKYQTLGGSFQVSVSKTFPIPVGRMFKAFAEAPQRNKWLQRGTLKVRTTTKNKSARFDFEDGSSRVVAWFDPKERSKTTVTLQHEKLSSSKAVDEMRVFWKERLGELAGILKEARS